MSRAAALSAEDGWIARSLGAGIEGGTADRRLDLAALTARWAPDAPVLGTQVHGAGIAVITGQAPEAPLAGCDALLTAAPGIVLVARSADCVPVLLSDARQRVVGIAHAGWRGIAAALPARLVEAARRLLHARPSDLRAAIGPAVRACCYEVGPEFANTFGPYLRTQRGRRTCDLAAAVADQLRAAGLGAGAIEDSAACTSCQARWFSIRRDGPSTGRLLSFIRLR